MEISGVTGAKERAVCALGAWLDRWSQRGLCTHFGCDGCLSCWPLRHCIHCGANDGRFIERPQAKEQP